MNRGPAAAVTLAARRPGASRADWTEQAACRGMVSADWDPWCGIDGPKGAGGKRDSDETQAARTTCLGCPVLAECRADIDRREGDRGRQALEPAIYAGETPTERLARRAEVTS